MKLSHQSKQRRVVVTGIGVIAPNGVGKDAFWAAALAGRSGVVRIDEFETDGLKSKIAGLVQGFDAAESGLSAEQSDRLDRYAQFAIAATHMALSDARVNANSFDPERTGVSIANAICGTRVLEEEFLRITQQGTASLDPNKARRFLYQWSNFNAASSEVAARYGYQGPCCTLATGCTAGLDAIGFSLDLIRNGKADVMVTGGTEAPVTPIAMAAFDVIGALSSKRNDTPSLASRPFDKDRDGFVLAEGCGILVLEEYEHAKARQAPIYAEIVGFGTTCNAYHMTDLPPDGEDLALSISLAIKDAGIHPEQIDYVNAHGSSTPQNDTNETAAYKRVFGKHAYRLRISSLKSMNGHPLAAANAIECAATLLSMNTSRIAPTINYDNTDPSCDLDYVPNRSIEATVNVALKNASGFSGIHSAVVFANTHALR
jgi:beta-ketoacyl-acyl-carrier-protein synthase II